MNVALIQMCSTENKQKNIVKALDLVKQAASRRAELICLPEVFVCRGLRPTNRIARTVAENIPGPTTQLFCALAKTSRSAILLGSIYEKAGRCEMMYNTSVLISREGKVIGKYCKRNLFRARVGTRTIDETKAFLPGKRGRTAIVQGLRLGMSVCYDVRFPQLYRQYARTGCQALLVPSNFTKKTGEAHWEVLLRARAVENLCYVLAPNQVGAAKGGVRAYGNSMIVDPWGRVVARATGSKEEIVSATIKQEDIRAARKALPGFNI